MSCYYQRGNKYANTPATIVLYGFNQGFTRLRFCFTANNPSGVPSTALPITIYTLSGTSSFTKTYYQTIEKGIIIRSTTSTLSESGTPTFNTYRTSDSSSLTINLRFATQMLPTDYYIIKTPALGITVASSTTLSLGGFGSANVLILPKNQFIVINPTSTVSASTYSVTISGLKNPPTALGSSTLLRFTGFVSHFTALTCEKITYSTPSSDFTGLDSFPIAPTISLSTAETRQRSIMTVTINAIFRTMRSVIIRVPTQLTLGVDCYESPPPSNDIKILQCTTDSSNRFIYITLEDDTFPATAQNLQIRVLVTNGATAGAISPFDYYVYTVVNTNPAVIQGVGYSVTGVNPSPTTALTAGVPSANPPDLLEVDYAPYIENVDALPSGTHGDLRFQFTLPVAIDTTYKITISLSSALLQFTSESLGDFEAQPAVIISEATALSAFGGHKLVLATYSANLLSFNVPASFSSGQSPSFRITQVTRTGENIGLAIANPLTTTALPLELKLIQGATTTHFGLLGTLYLKSTKYDANLASVLTRSPGDLNAWEFQFYLPSTIDNLYIDFPTVDEYGNSLFDATLGGLTDKSSIACASLHKAAGLENPECIFFTGGSLNTRPAKIWVRGITPPGTGIPMSLFIIGPQNPSSGRRIYFNTRFYTGDSFEGITRIYAYDTITSAVFNTPAADNTNFPATASNLHSRGSNTFTFRTGVNIPSDTILLVKLDPLCTTYSNTGGEFATKGVLGTFVLKKTTALISGSSGTPGPYTFSNFQCTKTDGLSFVGYHMKDPLTGEGEKRPSNMVMSTATRNSVSSITLPAISYVLSGNAYSTSNLRGRFTFDLSNIQSTLTITPGYVITMAFTNLFFDTPTGISSCQVYKGFTQITVIQPILCTVTATNTIQIKDFGGIIGSSEHVQILLTFQSKSSGYSSGQVDVKVYSDIAHVSTGDHVLTSSISVPTPTTPSSVGTLNLNTLSFQTDPYPTFTGTSVIQIGANSFSPSFVPTSAHTLRINFESLGIITSTTLCYLSNTVNYLSCVPNVAAQTIQVTFDNYGSTVGTLFATDITITNLKWPLETGPLYFSAHILSSGTITHSTKNLLLQLQGNNVPSIPMSADPIHLNNNGIVNEIHIQATLPIALDSTKLFSISYSGFTVRQTSLNQIDCVCNMDATCYHYDGIEKSLDIVFDSIVPAFTPISCYIPDITKTGNPASLDTRIKNPVNRAIYFSKSFSLTTVAFTNNPHTLSIDYPTPPITSSTTAQVKVTINSGFTYGAGSIVYLDFGLAGPIPPSCGAAPLSSCRRYSKVRNIYVLVLPSVTSGTFTIFDEVVSFPALGISSDTANYAPYSFVSNNNGQNIISQTTLSISPSNYGIPQTALTVTADQKYLGVDSMMKITFSSGSYPIPTTGAFIVELNGATNIGTRCYASISNVEISCSATAPTSSSSVITITPTEKITSETIEVFLTGTNPPTSNNFFISYHNDI